MRRKIHRRGWMKETEMGNDVISKGKIKTKYFATVVGYPPEKTPWTQVLSSRKASSAGQQDPRVALGLSQGKVFKNKTISSLSKNS